MTGYQEQTVWHFRASGVAYTLTRELTNAERNWHDVDAIVAHIEEHGFPWGEEK